MKYYHHQNTERGFTLMETVVYLALFSIIIGGSVIGAYGISESAGRNQAKAMLQEEGTFLIGKIDWVLSGVNMVNTPSMGEVSSNLSVTKYDNSLISLSLSGTTLIIQKGATSSPLSNTNVDITGLTFTHTGTSSDSVISEGVTAVVTMTTRAPNGMTFTQNFSTTKFLRK